VGSNPRGIVVAAFIVYVLVCVGRGLATGLCPAQEVLPTVYGIKKLERQPRPTEMAAEPIIIIIIIIIMFLFTLRHHMSLILAAYIAAA
jgi:hypothetical protein